MFNNNDSSKCCMEWMFTIIWIYSIQDQTAVFHLRIELHDFGHLYFLCFHLRKIYLKKFALEFWEINLIRTDLPKNLNLLLWYGKKKNRWKEFKNLFLKFSSLNKPNRENRKKNTFNPEHQKAFCAHEKRHSFDCIDNTKIIYYKIRIPRTVIKHSFVEIN